MYAIRSYYAGSRDGAVVRWPAPVGQLADGGAATQHHPAAGRAHGGTGSQDRRPDHGYLVADNRRDVITSYSIHYTKLYEAAGAN